MIYLMDTNVLLGVAHRTDARYPIVQEAVHKLWENAQALRTTSQNFAEFWNVSTRPTDQNGFGQTPVETNDLLKDLEAFFPLIPDSPEVYPVWRRLVVDYDVSGFRFTMHDWLRQ